LQHSSESTRQAPRKLLTVGRLWDVLALLAIGFVIWKIFLAPRVFEGPRAHPAPAAVFERLDGGVFRLADHRGGVVFLDFYASWCEPCKLSLPLVGRWSQGHPGALVAAIDVGEPRSTAEAFARQYGLRNVMLDPSSSARALFAVEGFPSVVVVDPRGYVRAKWEGLNPAIALAMSNALSSFDSAQDDRATTQGDRGTTR
jgi:cytochrome c biogenesis protein CcmG, thiol:disulfide interchange protein DsbE